MGMMDLKVTGGADFATGENQLERAIFCFFVLSAYW